MNKIKGPIKISGGFNARKFLEEKMKDVKIKLPFAATGWKSSKNDDLVNKEAVKTEKKAVKAKAKPKKKKGFFK